VATLIPAVRGSSLLSVPFNLTSSRTFRVTEGRTTFYAKLILLRLDEFVARVIHGGNMSALFVAR
jgi:hypothetical protein